jgi:hypothetical protein
MKSEFKPFSYYEGIADEHGAMDALEKAWADMSRMHIHIQAMEKDMHIASETFMVSIPEPGTVMARLLSANSILRQRCQHYREAVLDCIEALRHVHELPGVHDNPILQSAWESAIMPLLCHADDLIRDGQDSQEEDS